MTDEVRLDLPSASQLEIVVECPGMINLKASIPKEKLQESRNSEEDDWAASGTRIHKAFQTGSTLELNNVEVDTYNQGQKFLEAQLERWIDGNGLDGDKVVECPRELRIWIPKPWDFPKPMFSGQLDRHYLYRNNDRCLLFLADLKCGWNPNLPPSNRSWQLKSGLIAAWAEEYPDIEGGRVCYIKAKNKVESFDFCDYSAQDLKYSMDAVVFHCWQSTQEDAPRHAGPWCRWCAVKAHCPEGLSFALLPSQMVRMSKVGRKREIATEEVIPEDLYKLWQFKSAITAILEAVIDRLKTFTDEDLAKIGLMRGKAREGRYFTNLKDACMFLTEEKALFAPEQVWQHMDLALGPLASIYALRTGNTEEASKEYLKGILAPYMGVKEGERSIVRLK